jgi:REP element-mobilizing transposase RayT
MGRSRYVISEPSQPHFLTCTVLEWLPIFTRPDAVQILFNTWTYQRQNHGLRLYGYVVLENHLHFAAQAPRLDRCVAGFKSWTATRLIELLEQHQVERILARLRFAKRAHKTDREHQFWQEGSHAEMIMGEEMLREKLEYIHRNPVKRGYVDLPEHWCYSSARNYLGEPGLVEIDRWF